MDDARQGKQHNKGKGQHLSYGELGVIVREGELCQLLEMGDEIAEVFFVKEITDNEPVRGNQSEDRGKEGSPAQGVQHVQHQEPHDGNEVEQLDKQQTTQADANKGVEYPACGLLVLKRSECCKISCNDA